MQRRGAAGMTDTFAVVPVLAIAAIVVLVLLLLSPSYGFHRDELYFIVAGRHPAFGYPDQPPLTPLLSAAAVSLLGTSPTAVRILPALSLGTMIVLTAAMSREMGGTRQAQVIAALTLAVSGALAAGQLGSTATYDLLAWALMLWLVVRVLGGADPRWWLVAGIVGGIALENKHIPLFLGGGLAIGLLVARRWDVVRSPWLWAGAAIALVLWLPNLAWQVSHGMPQLEMAASIAEDADENRVELLPQLLLLSGLFTFPVTIAGFGWLSGSRDAVPWRPIAWATVAVLVVVFVTGGKSYYWAGFLPALMAAGSIVVDGWIARGHTWLRAGLIGLAAAATLAVSATLVLPVVPAASLASTPIPDIYDPAAEQIGWPELVSTVEGVVATLTPEQRVAAVILTANYGEAAALEVLGSGLPPVHSGHNGYWDWGPPRDDLTFALVLNDGNPAGWGSGLGPCELRLRFDNGLGLANQEQGVGVWTCPTVTRPWSASWAGFRHLD